MVCVEAEVEEVFVDPRSSQPIHHMRWRGRSCCRAAAPALGGGGELPTSDGVSIEFRMQKETQCSCKPHILVITACHMFTIPSIGA